MRSLPSLFKRTEKPICYRRQAHRAGRVPGAPSGPGEPPSPLTRCTSRPLRAVQGEVLELAFEVGLHLKEFDTEHLGVDDERIGRTVPDLDRLDEKTSRHMPQCEFVGDTDPNAQGPLEDPRRQGWGLPLGELRRLRNGTA